MQLAKVIGRATATTKHATRDGCRLRVIQPPTQDGGPDGEPGSAAREIMGVKNTPARWVIIGQQDERGR